MWKDFQESFANTGHRVLGRRLRPFCLYYQFWLDTLDLPLLRGEPSSLADLELGTRLCCCRYGEAEAMVGRRIGRLGQARWLLKTLRTRADREFAAFDVYIRDWFAPPETRFKAPATEDGTTYQMFPPTLSLACALIKHTGWEPPTVWMLPLGQVHWYLQGFLRAEGVETGLVTPHDEEFMEGLRREREHKKGTKGDGCAGGASPEKS